MRSHKCDLVTADDATHQLTILLHKLDDRGEPAGEPVEQLVFDAGDVVADRVKAGDLYGLGRLAPKPKADSPKPRTSRRGAAPAAVAGAIGSTPGGAGGTNV